MTALTLSSSGPEPHRSAMSSFDTELYTIAVITLKIKKVEMFNLAGKSHYGLKSLRPRELCVH